MKLLVDTCTFLWIAAESPRLSKTAAKFFWIRTTNATSAPPLPGKLDSNTAAGRLPLPERPDLFVPMIREASGIDSLEIDEESALHVGILPELHSDPFDRMLVAQAIVHGMTILTPDPKH